MTRYHAVRKVFALFARGGVYCVCGTVWLHLVAAATAIYAFALTVARCLSQIGLGLRLADPAALNICAVLTVS